MIRKIENIEQVRIDKFGQRFANEVSFRTQIVEPVWKKHWHTFLINGLGAIWVMEKDEEQVGWFGALSFPDVNDGQLNAQEMFWYVLPDHRRSVGSVRLLDEFEGWALKQGATRVFLTHLMNSLPEKLRDLYIRRGYKALETNYVKEL